MMSTHKYAILFDSICSNQMDIVLEQQKCHSTYGRKVNGCYVKRGVNKCRRCQCLSRYSRWYNHSGMLSGHIINLQQHILLVHTHYKRMWFTSRRSKLCNNQLDMNIFWIKSDLKQLRETDEQSKEEISAWMYTMLSYLVQFWKEKNSVHPSNFLRVKTSTKRYRSMQGTLVNDHFSIVILWQ